jgi:polyhydroxyalkanoate synthesis repressor PhaR
MTVVIKKYENRRLYDTSASRYVNLEEIAGMIRKGVDVQVVDSKTNEDLTRQILTQIITEEAKGNDSSLPLDLLRQMIRASSQAQSDLLSWYLRSSFENFQKFQEALKAPAWGLAGMRSPFDWMQGFAAPQQQPPPGADVRSLMEKISELERRLAEQERQQQQQPRTK